MEQDHGGLTSSQHAVTPLEAGSLIKFAKAMVVITEKPPLTAVAMLLTAFVMHYLETSLGGALLNELTSDQQRTLVHELTSAASFAVAQNLSVHPLVPTFETIAARLRGPDPVGTAPDPNV